MSKFAGFVIGAIEVGIGIATGNVALIVQGGMTIAAQAIVDLTAPKTPAREASEMTIKLGEQPRVLQVGETYTPGSLVDGFDYGGKYGTDWEVLVIRLADHKCQSLTGFYVNDDYKLYKANGLVPGYNGQLKIFFRGDTTNDALPDIVTENGPGWSSADIGESGCDVIVAYKADSPKAKHPIWPAGRPRFGFVIKGALCYDPRKDSTVTGGSGAHRIDDADTWEWSENAIVCWYKYERGVYANDDNSDQTKLLVGRGLTAEESPPEMIFAAANLCDELEGLAYPDHLLPTAFPMRGSLSPDFTRLYLGGGGGGGFGFQVWNVKTRTMLIQSSVAAGSVHLAVNEDGSFYGQNGDHTCLITTSGAVTPICGGMEGVWLTNAGLFGKSGLVSNTIRLPGGDLTTTDSIATNFYPSWFFDDEDGTSWAVGGKTSGGSYTTGFGLYDLTAGVEHLVSTSTGGDAYAFDNGNGQYFVRQDGKLYLVDKSTFAITAGPVAAAYAANEQPFWSTQTGDTAIWIGFTRYSTLDLSVLETARSSDYPTGTSAANAFYDRLNDALWTKGTLDDAIAVRFLHRNGSYRVSGPIYANQPFIDVEQMFAAATAGSIVTRDGSVEIEPGQAKSVTATFTDADLLSGSKVSWNQGFLSESSDEWINTVVGTYVEPDQKWNSHSAPPVRNTANIIADGKPRESQLALRLVRYRDQALRIAEVARRLGRLWGRAAVTLGPRFCEIEDGDWIQWQSDRYFGGATKIFRVEAYSIDASWQITLTLREIVGEAFAADGVFDADLSIPSATAPPPDIGSPDSDNWTLAAVTLPSGGVTIPALRITGSADDDEYAEAIIVEYWLDDGVTDPTIAPDAVPWTSDGSFSPDTTVVDITSVVGAETYYAAVSYIVGGVTGDRLVLGPVTLAGFGTGIRTADTTFITADDTTRRADLG